MKQDLEQNRMEPEEDPRVRQVELIISKLLRTGVLVSLAVVVAGMMFTFVHHPNYLHATTELRPLVTPGADFPRTLTEVVHGALRLNGRALVMIGLFLLIATPIMRVAVSIFAFAYQRDRIFVVITSVVLALLLTSFFVGHAGG